MPGPRCALALMAAGEVGSVAMSGRRSSSQSRSLVPFTFMPRRAMLATFMTESSPPYESPILAYGGLPDAAVTATRETSRGSEPGDGGSKPGDLLLGVEVVHRRAADGREVPALEVEPGR